MRQPTLSRRGFATGAALATLLPAAARAAAPAESRAEQWHAAMERAFAVGDGTGLYREYHPAEAGDERYSTEWPFSQAHAGVLDLAMVPGAIGRRFAPALTAIRAAQQRYWATTSTTGRAGHLAKVVPPLGQGDDLFYDDNEWVGLAEVQHHRFRRDAESLRRARAIFALIRSGWSEEKGLPSPGGVVWTQKRDNGDRNTVSNMPAAQLGVRLYLLTRERGFLDDALRYYRWTNATLQRPDGLYADHIKRDGTIEQRVWTYNQGVPVGVNVLLWRATGEERYLAEARRIAAASYRWFVTSGRVDDQPPPFNAIYFKNLLLLAAVTGERRDLEAMRGYAERMWRRRNSVGLVRFPNRRAELIDTAALVQVEAVLAWRRSDWPLLY